MFQFDAFGAKTYLIIWLAPWAGKMNQILRCDWATRAGKMELSCPLETTRRVPQEKFPWKPYNIKILYWPSFFDQDGWILASFFFFASLWTSTPPRSINMQKKNLGQYPTILTEQAWSITHIYSSLIIPQFLSNQIAAVVVKVFYM